MRSMQSTNDQTSQHIQNHSSGNVAYETMTGSEDEGTGDLANTHATNERLLERQTIRQLLESLLNLDDLSDQETRAWLGSLPSTMADEAIPLFTDNENGVDYQLHFSYTWMKAVHTYQYHGQGFVPGTEEDEMPEDEMPDYYVHSLVESTNPEECKPVPDDGPYGGPQIVIPLGKLFVNSDKRSQWTGYEVLMSSRKELWIIDVFDEREHGIWHHIQCGLATKPIGRLGEAKELLRDDGIEGFSIAKKCLGYSAQEISGRPRRSFMLLEVAASEASSAISSSLGPVAWKIFETKRFKVNEQSPAGRELIALACRTQRPMLKLEISDTRQKIFQEGQGLKKVIQQYGTEDQLLRDWAGPATGATPENIQGVLALRNSAKPAETEELQKVPGLDGSSAGNVDARG